MQLSVLAQIDILDTGFADVEDSQLGVFRNVEAFNVRNVDREAQQFGATGRVEFAKALIGISAERHEQRIVRKIEFLVEVLGLTNLEDGESRVVRANFERADVEWVVVDIYCEQVMEIREVERLEFVVRSGEELQFGASTHLNFAHIATTDVEILNVIGITVDANNARLIHIASKSGSGVRSGFGVVSQLSQLMLFSTGAAVNVNPVAFGKACNHYGAAVGGTKLVIEIGLECDDGLGILRHST